MSSSSAVARALPGLRVGESGGDRDVPPPARGRLGLARAPETSSPAGRPPGGEPTVEHPHVPVSVRRSSHQARAAARPCQSS